MFGLARRVKALEEKIAKIEQDKKCASGSHIWTMDSYSSYEPPFIKCSNCWARPPEKKS